MKLKLIQLFALSFTLASCSGGGSGGGGGTGVGIQAEAETDYELYYKNLKQKLSSDVIQIVAGHKTFAALKKDGSVVAWGLPWSGGDTSEVAHLLKSGVKKLYALDESFVAFKNDNSIVYWGGKWSKGGYEERKSGQSFGISSVTSNNYFVAAKKIDGSYIVIGGSTLSSIHEKSLVEVLGNKTKKLYLNGKSAIALQVDGSIRTWARSGGEGRRNLKMEEMVGNKFKKIEINKKDLRFIITKKNGDKEYMSPSVNYDSPQYKEPDYSEVDLVMSSTNAWGTVALKKDGTLISPEFYNPYMPLSDTDILNIQARSKEYLQGRKVKDIYSNDFAFAILDEQGMVSTFGNKIDGDGEDSDPVRKDLNSGVKSIYSTWSAFAALKTDGSVVTWGDDYYGGEVDLELRDDLKSDVKEIYSSDESFVAIKKSGKAIFWGKQFCDYQIDSDIESGVVKAYFSEDNIAFLKTDGSVIVCFPHEYDDDSTLY